MWYSQPRQRQRWGSNDILPCGNWSQIFFDLFYVGGAYNLGNILKYSSNSLGVLYFSGTAFPAMMMWFDKMYYDARFTTCHPKHDTFHRVLDLMQLCCVATALSRIRTVDVLQDTCNHIDMFQFALSCLIYCCITIFRYMEIAYVASCNTNDNESNSGFDSAAAGVVAGRDLRWMMVPTLCLLGAVVDSGFSYYSKDSPRCNEYDERYNTDYYQHTPILLCLMSWIIRMIWGYFDKICCLGSPATQGWYEKTVPVNIQFCVHRYGEWFMIMFGESIVSLLIVDSNNENFNHWIAFYSGILSIIFLAHIHFRLSEPKDVTHHALWRSRHSAYFYTVMVPIYSSALIAIGVSYKMFLYDYMYNNNKNDDNDDDHRIIRRHLGGGGNENGDEGKDGEDDYYGYEDDSKNQELMYTQQFRANLFSGSIATVLICTDLMVLLHTGIPCIVTYARTIPKIKLTLIVLAKYTIVVFLACLCLLKPNPHVMIFCGLGAILAQELLRAAFFQDENHHHRNNRRSSQNKGDHQDDNSTIGTDESIVSNISIHYFYQVATQSLIHDDIDVNINTLWHGQGQQQQQQQQEQEQEQQEGEEGEGDEEGYENMDNLSLPGAPAAPAASPTEIVENCEAIMRVENGIVIQRIDHDSKFSRYERAESYEIHSMHDFLSADSLTDDDDVMSPSECYTRMAEC